MATILTNFEPKRREISAVSLAQNALVTTTDDHGYLPGYIIRFFIPDDYGMRMENVKAEILTVPADDQFTVNLNTIGYDAFVAPTEPPPFTEAHCVVINGLQQNNTSFTE